MPILLRYNNGTSALKERQTWTIVGRMVTFPQLCLKVVKKLTRTWYLCSVWIDIVTSNSGRYFLLTLQVSKSCYRKDKKDAE